MIYGKARKQQIYTPHLSRSRQMLKNANHHVFNR
jgi:hypothetical protein